MNFITLLNNTNKNELIDKLNLAIALTAGLMAWAFPYRSFLIAFAVLGPLHYLTELHWIRSKSYFTASSGWKWFAAIGAMLIALPRTVYGIAKWMDVNILEWIPWLGIFSQYTDVLIFSGIAIAVILVLRPPKASANWFILSALLIAISLQSFENYHFIVGLLLPTIIHVYIFTLAFMLYGSLQSSSKWGFATFGLVLIIPFALLFAPINAPVHELQDTVKDTWLQSGFHILNTGLRAILGISDGSTFFFYEQAELKMQSIISFAYIYHYLNWFSKTTIIQWHQQITAKSGPLLAVVWFMLMGLFAVNYTLGFSVALIFSFAHVLFEFPVNIHSFKGIYDSLRLRLRSS